MKILFQVVFIYSLLGLGTATALVAEPQKHNCACKNCKCTPQAHCGCFDAQGCMCTAGHECCCPQSMSPNWQKQQQPEMGSNVQKAR